MGLGHTLFKDSQIIIRAQKKRKQSEFRVSEVFSLQGKFTTFVGLEPKLPEEPAESPCRTGPGAMKGGWR